MYWTVRVFGFPVLEVQHGEESTYLPQGGGSFEIAPEPPVEEEYEDKGFGFG